MEEAFDPDEFDLDSGETDPNCSCTTILRATVSRGRVWMTPWVPGLAEGGPSGIQFRARERAGVAIADLRLIRDASGEREVIVEFMAAGRAREGAEAALLAWAARVGCGRMWLPGGPVDIDPPPALATAEVKCPTCRAVWIDSSTSFWEEVNRSGHFPLVCPTCGHPLPQWHVVSGDTTRCRGA